MSDLRVTVSLCGAPGGSGLEAWAAGCLGMWAQCPRLREHEGTQGQWGCKEVVAGPHAGATYLPPSPLPWGQGTTWMCTIIPQKVKGRNCPAAARHQIPFRFTVSLGPSIFQSRVILEECAFISPQIPKLEKIAFSYEEQRTKLSSKKPDMF